MKYTYAYKTSDGRRHEAALNAPSREEAFAILRTQGIKPIKVIAADGSKANGEIVVRGIRKRVVTAVALSVALIVGICAFWLGREGRLHSPETAFNLSASLCFTSESSKSEYLELERWTVRLVEAKHRQISELFSSGTITERENIRQGYKLVDEARLELRERFKSLFEIFSSDCETERVAAQRLYGEAMERVNDDELFVINCEHAIGPALKRKQK